MQTAEMRRVRSGLDSSFGWVTLWYAAATRKLGVLHVVCDKEDRKLYLEGEDQSVACWGQATQVVVTDEGLQISLTKKGSKALSLPSGLTLTVPKGLVGWKKACKSFAVMAGYPSGRVISVYNEDGVVAG